MDAITRGKINTALKTPTTRNVKLTSTFKIWPNRLAGLSHAFFLSRIDRYITINRKKKEKRNCITAKNRNNDIAIGYGSSSGKGRGVVILSISTVILSSTDIEVTILQLIKLAKDYNSCLDAI